MCLGREITASYSKAMHTWGFLESGRASGRSCCFGIICLFSPSRRQDAGGEEKEATVTTLLLLSYWLPQRRPGEDGEWDSKPQAADCIFFSNEHGTFSRIDYVIGHKTNCNN